MSSNRKRFMQDNRGQSLVEFALILPMMLVVMFMITEFGRALFQFNVLSQAARDGARVAVVNGSSNAISAGETRMRAFLTSANMLSGTSVQCTIINNYQGVNGATVVLATADKPFTWAFKGPMVLQGNASVDKGSKASWTLHGEAIMKSETF
jgi:Flp pilus assembly protein TadG